MYRKTTFLADEFGLRLPVGLCDMPTLRTSPTGVPRIDEEDRDARKPCFVGNKPSEFVEGPLAESFTLLFSNRYPEALEVFKGDASSGVFGNLNDVLGNRVVGGALKHTLPTRELFEMPFSGVRSFLLKSFLDGRHPGTDTIHHFPGELLSVRCGCEVDDAEIHSQRSLRNERRPIGNFNTEEEKEIAFGVNKVGLSTDPALVELGVCAEDDGYLESPVKAQDAYRVQSLEGKDALVVDESRMLLEDVEPFLFGPVRFGNLADGADGKLGGKTIPVPNVVIAKMVKPNLAELLVLEGHGGGVVTGFVENLNGLYQRILLLAGWKELYLDCKFHGVYSSTTSIGCQAGKEGGLPLHA